MEQKIIRIKDVLKMIPICRSTLYKQIEEGRFPAPFKLSERCIAWKKTDIEKWLETRYQSG